MKERTQTVSQEIYSIDIGGNSVYAPTIQITHDLTDDTYLMKFMRHSSIGPRYVHEVKLTTDERNWLIKRLGGGVQSSESPSSSSTSTAGTGSSGSSTDSLVVSRRELEDAHGRIVEQAVEIGLLKERIEKLLEGGE